MTTGRDEARGPTATGLHARALAATAATDDESVLGPCYTGCGEPATELLRLHIPSHEPVEVAACATHADVLRLIADPVPPR